jgi:hypothetical protein
MESTHPKTESISEPTVLFHPYCYCINLFPLDNNAKPQTHVCVCAHVCSSSSFSPYKATRIQSWNSILVTLSNPNHFSKTPNSENHSQITFPSS